MLKKQFTLLKIFLDETLNKTNINHINLEENLIEFKDHYTLYIRPSLFKKTPELIPLIESLYWANENYKKSFEFRNLNLIPTLNKVESLSVSYDNIYENFIKDINNSIIIELFSKNNDLHITYNNDKFFIQKDSNCDIESIKETLNSLLLMKLNLFLNQLVKKDFVFFTANYVFESKNKEKKVSSVNIVVSLTECKIKIVNASKIIEVNLLKRAVNRLSLISQKLNDGFNSLSSGKAVYKIMFAGRRNAFEEFDRVIVESIILGKE